MKSRLFLTIPFAAAVVAIFATVAAPPAHAGNINFSAVDCQVLQFLPQQQPAPVIKPNGGVSNPGDFPYYAVACNVPRSPLASFASYGGFYVDGDNHVTGIDRDHRPVQELLGGEGVGVGVGRFSRLDHQLGRRRLVRAGAEGINAAGESPLRDWDHFGLPSQHGRDPIHLRQLQPLTRIVDWGEQRKCWHALLSNREKLAAITSPQDETTPPVSATAAAMPVR